MKPSEQVQAALADFPGVSKGWSKVGNSGHVAWFVGRKEFAHLHSQDVIDLRLPPNAQSRLKGNAVACFRKSKSPWVEVLIRSEAGAELAIAFAREAWAAAKEAT